MATDYVELMDKLRAGEIEEIEIDSTNFMAFRDAWTNYPERKEIVGTAKRGGKIIYHYVSANA
ncbi:hypothetical protein [Lacticaseibacillus hulanensis]|uniref:hypothetical protein n=1 Tax=Lacticaseibacillus hulanensis TaxID=2493111 RepID=UPI000FDAD3D6|nr:hypothetical protein [Lacticaseibacillus hulanensis]